MIIKGYVTKYNVLCTDGRTIATDAFKHQDGDIVPVSYAFDHTQIIGTAKLEHRPDGVYGLIDISDPYFIDALNSDHSYIPDLAIMANELQENNQRVVTYGIIREVALVHKGANPEAIIDTIEYEES